MKPPRTSLLFVALLLCLPAAQADYLLRNPGGFSGISAAPASLSVSRTAVDLGTVSPGGSALPQSVVLTNNGGRAGEVAIEAPMAPFSMSHDCPASLDSAAHCTVLFGFFPEAVGAFNGSATIAGAPISLAGNAIFTASGTLSVLYGNDYGTKTVGGRGDKTVELRNTGTNGALSVGFTLTGDTAHFKIRSVQKMANTAMSAAACDGVVIAADGLSATPCLADDATSYRKHITMQVRYEPKSVGSHSITIVPNTNNGTILPEPLVLLGAAQ